MNGSRTPVIFIHGLWLHATSWQPWLEVFRQAGYEAALQSTSDIIQTSLLNFLSTS